MTDRDPYDIRWHGHRLDPYRICVLYEVMHPALQHAAKKILCAGKRGTKHRLQDVEEAIRSLERYVEMAEEDADVVLAEFHEAIKPPADPEMDAAVRFIMDDSFGDPPATPPADPSRKLVRVDPQPERREGRWGWWFPDGRGAQDGLWWRTLPPESLPYPDAKPVHLDGIWYWVIPQGEETT